MPPNSDNSFGIVIPIYAEARDVLQFSKFYFEQTGYDPVYALDSKKIERRSEIEDILHQKIEIYDNPGRSYIEGHYDRLASLSPSDWVLRIDCDELPNREMLQYCHRFVCKPTDAFCGFDRDDLLWRGDRFERIKYAPLFFDTQFRLFNRTQVEFEPKIHSAGFKKPKWKTPLWPWWNAPLKARIYHLARTFVPEAQRLARMSQRQDYETGVGLKFREWNLRPDDMFKWRSFDDQWFTSLYAEWKKKKH